MNPERNPGELVDKARAAAKKAYSPYSNFHVGAVLLMEDGSLITGVNVENRSFGLTNCAERTAVFSAVSAGMADKIMAVAIGSPDTDAPLSPCGACRQVLSEFCSAETPVYYDDGKAGFITSTVGELLPQDALQTLSEKMNKKS